MRYKRYKMVILIAAVLTAAAGLDGCAGSGSIEAAGPGQADVDVGNTKEAGESSESVRSAEGSRKEEIVYVTADANGVVKEIVVSDILRNDAASDTITDQSDLKNIKNIKGKETYQTGQGGELIWQAGGNDIYYQGESDKELPVEVKITYYLNGEEIAPKKLAGRSGDVRIRFDYINHETQTIMVNGEERTISTPFMAVTGLFLDEEKFTNVEMEKGRVISDGSRIMAGGVAIPGLSDSIALSEIEDMKDLDIPEYLEVTAYTTGFELPLTMTAITSDLAGEIDLDDLDTYEDLKADMQELKDASQELIDGIHELTDGVEELRDGSVELFDGAVELDDGARKLNDGAWELDGGAKDLQEGAGDLKEALKSLNAGLDALAASMDNADGNGNDITVVAGQLSAGVGQLVDQELGTYLVLINEQMRLLSIQEFGNVEDFINFDFSQYGEAAALQGTQQQLRQLLALKSGMNQLSAGVGQIYNGVSGQLQPGAAQILDGAGKLYSGTGELKEGTEELLKGTAELKEGTVELLDGTVELKDGVQELYDGSLELRDGMEEFDRDGIQKLYGLVCNDLQNVIDRARAVADAGEAYQTFTRLSPGMEGSVKFLIETEAIE